MPTIGELRDKCRLEKLIEMVSNKAEKAAKGATDGDEIISVGIPHEYAEIYDKHSNQIDGLVRDLFIKYSEECGYEPVGWWDVSDWENQKQNHTELLYEISWGPRSDDECSDDE